MRRPFPIVLILFVLTLVASCRPAGPGGDAWRPAPPLAGRDQVASADGVPILYHAAGSGEPALVFVHGWSCDADYWAAQVRHFAPFRRVVAIDLAGHGGSGADRQAWTIEAFARDVAAVVESLDLDRVVLVGHSMSGPVTVEAARLMPDRVVALVPIDTLQRAGTPPTPEESESFIAPFREDFVQHTQTFVRSFFPEGADARLVEWVSRDMAAADPAVAIAALEGLFAYDARPALGGLRVPIHAINADLYPTDVEGNRAHAPQFEVSIMPAVGHFPMLEDPAAFNERLEEVLASAGAAAR